MTALTSIFDATFAMFVAKLTLAMLLGLILGLERVYAHKTAGMRTYAIVAMAAAFFVLIAQHVAGGVDMTPTGIDSIIRMASQIIVGVGFLGTGLIIFKDGHIENLTTAGGLWASAGIGMAAGFGMYREAIFATVLTFIVLGVLSSVERSIRLRVFPDPEFEKTLKKKPVRRARKVAVMKDETTLS